MNVSDRARALIEKSAFKPTKWPDGRYYDVSSGSTMPFGTLDKDILAASFAHVIDIGEKKLGKALGGSMEFGHPHMPKDFKPPKKLRFWMQINLDELGPHDKDEIFPDTGILWLFQHPEITDCAIHWDPKPGNLVVREDIEPLDGEPSGLSFSSKIVFYVNDGDAFDYGKVQGLVPAALKKSLESLFDCKLAKSSGAPEIFGRPIFWQGEDEDYDGDGDFEEDEAPKKKPKKKKTKASGPELLFNLEIDDAALHIWGEPAKVRKGNFKDINETSSTT